MVSPPSSTLREVNILRLVGAEVLIGRLIIMIVAVSWTKLTDL